MYLTYAAGRKCESTRRRKATSISHPRAASGGKAQKKRKPEKLTRDRAPALFHAEARIKTRSKWHASLSPERVKTKTWRLFLPATNTSFPFFFAGPKETVAKSDEVERAPLVGPLVVRVFPDGRPVPEDEKMPMPRDDDLEDLGKIPFEWTNRHHRPIFSPFSYHRKPVIYSKNMLVRFDYPRRSSEHPRLYKEYPRYHRFYIDLDLAQRSKGVF